VESKIPWSRKGRMLAQRAANAVSNGGECDLIQRWLADHLALESEGRAG
jgi:hypothetical protein